MYASGQFLGAFVGVALGGALYQWGGAGAVFAVTALVTLALLPLVRQQRQARQGAG